MPYSIQEVKNKFKFINVHGNYSEPFSEVIRLYNDEHARGYDSYNQTSEDIKSIIGLCLEKNLPLRACGSLWSLSKAPYVKGSHIFSYNELDELDLRYKTFLEEEECESGIDHSNMLFAQCGNRIKDLNLYCEEHNKSLRTSGASNGQTIAGAIGTGVNGSALNVGCIQDTILGLHLITGNNQDDSIFIQGSSKPAVTNTFAEKINARLITDDDLFNAAKVHLGAMGYVHGVLIETEDIFFLINRIFNGSLNDMHEFLATGSIENTSIELPNLDNENLYHIRFFINQYNDTVRVEVISKVHQLPRNLGVPTFLEYNKDFLIQAGKILGTIAPGTLPSMIDKRLPKAGSVEFGTLNQIFGDTVNLRAGQYSCAVAVDITHAEATVELLRRKLRRSKKIPVVLSLRFVPKTNALIGYTRHNFNCIIGLDGIQTKAVKRIVKSFAENLRTMNIPQTWHWGKDNYMDTDFVKEQYGSDRVLWLEQRNKLLDPKMLQMFSSDYLRKRGL